MPIAVWMDKHKPAAWVQISYGIMFFGFMLANIPLCIWLSKRQIRKYELMCPTCGKPLVGVSSQIAVATGNCGLCGSVVFEDA
jgi:hypothetical protein